MSWNKVGIFALGTLFGLEGVKLLSSKDAKKVYTHCTAGVLRVKDAVLDQVTTLQENCSDIYAEAKQINEDRAKKEKLEEKDAAEETDEAVDSDTVEEDLVEAEA